MDNIDGTAYLKLETVARGLGFTEISASGNECVKWSRVRKYLSDLKFIDTSVDGKTYLTSSPKTSSIGLAWILPMR